MIKTCVTGNYQRLKSFSVAQGDGKIYNEIAEDKIKSSTDMKVKHQKQMEDVRDIVINLLLCNQINHET